jgi:hypothetical protein
MERSREMKKLMAIVVCLGMFGFVGIVSALTFTHTEYLDVWLGGYGQPNSGTHTWTHNTPGDFEVPYDVVNYATLEVSASYVNWDNETIDVQGAAQGNLVDGTWSWFRGWYGSTEFDIADVFMTWNTGDPLNVALNYTERPRGNALRLDSSIFTLDYDNGTAPVPEPATILLMGTGLLGIIGFGRKRLNKKA